MENPETSTKNRNYSLGSLVAVGALFTVLGFGIGTNFDPSSLIKPNAQNQELPEDLNYDDIESVYDVLRRNFAGKLSLEDLQTGLKDGLVAAAGDPYTEYLDAEQAKELTQSLDGEFTGIGAEIGIRDELLTVIAPLDGTPAQKAGIRAGDVIAAINGDDASGLNVQEAVTAIRGEKGTDVVLTILRPKQPPKEITITRDTIELPSVKSRILADDIGYIELIQFGTNSATDFRLEAIKLRDMGAKKIILDVRNNPGGFLDVAVNIASEFLEPGKLVVEERRDDTVVTSELSQAGGKLIGLPTVVLINGGSASASEIIAGALRDQNVAKLVGEQTFGKGSVQQLIGLDGGSILRVTIANWYTPGGKNISKEGVTPDVEVKLTEQDFIDEKDPQLDRAIRILKAE